MGEFDYLDIQNASIRQKAKKEMIKGIVWCIVAGIVTLSTYSLGKIYGWSLLLFAWGFYKFFIASKYYVLGRHAVEFSKPKDKPTSSVVGGRIYRHKD